MRHFSSVKRTLIIFFPWCVCAPSQWGPACQAYASSLTPTPPSPTPNYSPNPVPFKHVKTVLNKALIISDRNYSFLTVLPNNPSSTSLSVIVLKDKSDFVDLLLNTFRYLPLPKVQMPSGTVYKDPLNYGPCLISRYCAKHCSHSELLKGLQVYLRVTLTGPSGYPSLYSPLVHYQLSFLFLQYLVFTFIIKFT